ncbi:hypothetical protein CPB84DRAFT_1763066 [Gymnopilus junonius]|uniref:Replication protein A C-terminal domain-containing protein n=1 Tax=Gymnopilus junonius TaxID=109634 RepID=A0A9P5P0T9_GYMJU|nr:hypothetical protein CPB84DRAFT_1763066 [Gymnopilus junonius]
MALLSQSAGEPSSFAPYIQKSISNEGLRRVTIRQLLDAVPTGDSARRFGINGSTINKVMLVVNIYYDSISWISPGHTCRSYGLDDGTGRLTAYSYESGTDHILDAFAYARVVGELVDDHRRSRSLKILNIQPIYDPHEIYFHILHSIFESLIVERDPPPIEVISSTPFPGFEHRQQEPSIDVGFQQLSLLGHTSEASRLQASGFTHPNLPAPTGIPFTQLDFDVMSCLSNTSLWQENGVNIEDLISHIKRHRPAITSRELSDSIEFLIEARRITITVDDWHYRLL